MRDERPDNVNLKTPAITPQAALSVRAFSSLSVSGIRHEVRAVSSAINKITPQS